MSIAFLFPGQGSQKIGMGYDLYSETEIGKRYFDLANEILGADLQDIIFNGPEELLKQTQYTQPAIYVVSVVLGELLMDKGLLPSAAAGHSLGEYSAFTIAGAFDFSTGLELVKIRSESMQKAGTDRPGTMAAVLGLGSETISEICDQYQNNGIVVAANINAPGQVVISGDKIAVLNSMEKFKTAGALKVIELNVSGAFHSPLMIPAREALAEILNSIEIQDTRVPVYSNVTANPVSGAEEIKQVLIHQLEKPVLWQNTINNMIKNNISKYIEVGPGRVLQSLTKRIDRRLETDGIDSLDKIRNNGYV